MGELNIRQLMDLAVGERELGDRQIARASPAPPGSFWSRSSASACDCRPSLQAPSTASSAVAVAGNFASRILRQRALGGEQIVHQPADREPVPMFGRGDARRQQSAAGPVPMARPRRNRARRPERCRGRWSRASCAISGATPISGNSAISRARSAGTPGAAKRGDARLGFLRLLGRR